MISIKEAIEQSPSLSARLNESLERYPPDYFRERLPELAEMDVNDKEIRIASVQLYEILRQREQCQGCTGFHQCKRPEGQKGLVLKLGMVNEHLHSAVADCPMMEAHYREERWQRVMQLSGKALSDRDFTFASFPEEQKLNHYDLCDYIFSFAKSYKPGASMDGVYIFGPPGVAKTHLLLAMVNRLEDRRIPVLFIRTDAVFRNMRGMLSRKESLDSLIEAYCTAPVLVIDEFGQEGATDFTVDVMFEILNARFTAKLPTFMTSNYDPDTVYAKAAKKFDLGEKVEAIRSRLYQMTRHAKMTGRDGRRINRPSFL